MLNNKGQSLVLFVVILPIVLLMLVLIIDVGKAISLKYELDNISDIVLDYGLNQMDKDNLVDELEELVILNKSDIDNIDIKIEDDRIYLNLNEKYEGVFSSFVDISIFNIKSSYVGYIDGEEKRIENLGD